MVEPLAVLLLPGRLEEFTLREHAQALLAIPRVIALEARRSLPGGMLVEALAVRQARRLRLPGEPRVLVLYHPRQYLLARALQGRFPQTELWYVAGDAALTPGDGGEVREWDTLARERAAAVLRVSAAGDPAEENLPLRRRLLELEIISHRPFVPGARIRAR